MSCQVTVMKKESNGSHFVGKFLYMILHERSTLSLLIYFQINYIRQWGEQKHLPQHRCMHHIATINLLYTYKCAYHFSVYHSIMHDWALPVNFYWLLKSESKVFNQTKLTFFHSIVSQQKKRYIERYIETFEGLTVMVRKQLNILSSSCDNSTYSYEKVKSFSKYEPKNWEKL